MLITLGLLGTVVGASFAAGARRFPSYELAMERWGGGIFLSGLALIGLAFPAI